MSGALVILRREVSSYFNSIMAYVVAISFMVLTTFLYVLDLWRVDQVSMRGFFDWTSWTACLVIPAITMRTWSEERRGATYELLLTMPLRSSELVLGKFLGALVFYLFCLSGSLVLPVILWTLSTPGLGPDWGAIFAGYVGTVLAGCLLIALGTFVSALCRDQIVAFIVALVVAVGLKLVGFGPIADQIDALAGGVGTFLRDDVSFTVPLSRFIRGVIGFGDVLFFLAWTGVLLFLNVVRIEGSMRPKTHRWYAAGVALGLLVAVLLGGLVRPLGPRWDLTADRLFTVSDSAREVLAGIPEGKPVQVKLYFSPKAEMPAALSTLERDVVERLDEYQRLAGNRMTVEVVHLHADDAILRAFQEARASLGEEDGDEGDRGAVEERLLQEGVIPFRVRTGGLTGSETKVVYAALTLAHGAADKEIIPQLLPEYLGLLEQDLITRVYRLVNEERPVVGLLAPVVSVEYPPQQVQLMQQLGMPMPEEQDDYRLLGAILGQNEQYDVRRLRPDAEAPLPPDLDALVVVKPEGLSPRLQWEIGRFLHGGGAVFVAAQSYEASLRPSRAGATIGLRTVTHGLDDLLADVGLSLPPEMVMAPESFPLTYSFGPFGGQVTVDFRWAFRLDASNFDQSTALSNGVGNFVLINAAAPVRIDEAKVAELGLDVTPVLRSGESSWTRPVPTSTYPEDLNDKMPGAGPIPLAVLARGQFPAPAEQPPDPAGEEWDAPAVGAPAPGSLLVLGTAEGFDDVTAVDPGGGLSWSAVLMKNSVDALSLGDVLLGLTAREPRSRPIRELDRAGVRLHQVLFIALAPLVYALIGLARLAVRHRRRDRPYTPLAAGLAGGGEA